MSLTDLVLAEVKRPGTTCTTCTVIASLTDEQRAELQALLEQKPRIPNTAIAKGLAALTGQPVTESSFTAHRRRGCSGG